MSDSEYAISLTARQAVADFFVNYEPTAEHRLLLRLLA